MHKQIKLGMKRNQKEYNKEKIGAIKGTNPDDAGTIFIFC